ncbi:MAG: ligase-associated DNA damage response exonuclease [Bacteroidia bacterium]|nr:ligase-associated DNA damage response exonuclease [Bacteroidia bacterium]
MKRWLYPTPQGLYCEPGGFYIDPWRPVEYALITHSHSDHARFGSQAYLTVEENVPLLRHRLGDVRVEGLPWGETRSIGGVKVSFHPAGHIRGAAQIRLEWRGEVWVITGDYKRHPDPTTLTFEPLRAHGLISECTFGLPIYQWASPAAVIEEIIAWWQACRSEGKNAILYAYSLGKAQRLLASLPPVSPIYVHGSLVPINRLYEKAGIRLAAWKPAAEWKKEKGILLIAPPAAQKSRWLTRFEPYEEAQASGWMAIRGRKRQKALDRGFPLSDHADFYQILETLKETGAEEVVFTHGYTATMTRLARFYGYNAYFWETAYRGEEGASEEAERAEMGLAEDRGSK